MSKAGEVDDAMRADITAFYKHHFKGKGPSPEKLIQQYGKGIIKKLESKYGGKVEGFATTIGKPSIVTTTTGSGRLYDDPPPAPSASAITGRRINTRELEFGTGHAEKFGSIQTTVFTNWINMKLSAVGVEPISELHGENNELKSGLKLKAVLEAVSGKTIKKIKEGDSLGKIVEMANLTEIFKFLKKESVKITNSGPMDVWDGTDTIVLGLVWAIIYHYQVSRGIILGGVQGKKLAERNSLLKFIQTKIPDLKITNLTYDWKDGRALSALVNKAGAEVGLPNLIPGSPPGDAATIIELCFAQAERISVGRLLTAEQWIDQNCDEKSMVVYLSQFANVKRAEVVFHDALRFTSSPVTSPLASPTTNQSPMVSPEPGTPPVERRRSKLFTEITDPSKFFPRPTDSDEFNLEEVSALFDAMDSDSDGIVTKYELIEFLREHKAPHSTQYPRGITVAVVVNALGFDTLHEINRDAFADVFRARKLETSHFDLSRMKRVLDHVAPKQDVMFGVGKPAKQYFPGPEARRTHHATVTRTNKDGEEVQQEEVPWREYTGHDLGGRCKIVIYYSSTAVTARSRKSFVDMEALLKKSGWSERLDYGGCIPIDQYEDKEKRDNVYNKAGTLEVYSSKTEQRKSEAALPFLFVDDEFVGGWDKVKEMYDSGALAELIENY